MKTFIKNRRDQRLSVVVEEQSGPLTFVSHGLGGNKYELQTRAVAEPFYELGHTVVTFDNAHSFGESDGLHEDATLTGYHHDLCDVIDWAAHQPWYREPFTLAGSSFGGISSGLYAQNFPFKVSNLAMVSPLISGELSLQSPKWTPEKLAEWKRTGVVVQKRRNGDDKRLKWACMEDRLKHNLLTKADQLSMPTLIVVGEKDSSTPPKHQRILFDSMPFPKEMHIIPDMGHLYTSSQECNQLRQVIHTWASKYAAIPDK